MKQAIYREFRPKDFSRVIGQKHIVEILKNQIKSNTLGHAYLFSGIRGTGKTSCAKIFARAVNCLNPIDGNPCNECENCKMILEDKALEVVEMDAASNRRIDDIRELKEKVIYPPQNVKYKVYIIDEAHMITNEGFNALLKIMEEPPKHLIFILATTEIEKLPDTIISRCQRFEFKRISNSDIKENINFILNEINVNCEESGIELISEMSSGAMRDALSLLDQVVSTGKKSITTEDINEALGLVSLNNLFEISKSISESNINNAISDFRKLVESGKNPVNVISDLTKHFRNILLVKNIERRLTTLNDVEYKKYFEHSKSFSIDELIFFLENLIETEGKLKRSDLQNAISELFLIKICNFKKEKNSLEKRIESLENIIKSGKLSFSNEEVESTQKTSFLNPFDDYARMEKEFEDYSEDFKVEKVEQNTEINFKDEFKEKNEDEKQSEIFKNDKKDEEFVLDEEIDLNSFRDIIKGCIFKRTISKLFDESVKNLVYHTSDNFLQVDCKEYLFKFGSYKLDENNSFKILDREILDEFFTKTGLAKKDELVIFANFVS